MKKNRFFLFPFSFLLCASVLASCDDFFEPSTSDALSGDDYMSSLTEMTTGYLGVLTRMQAIGDKEIYLTDTRGELLEPTEQSIAELISIYNYDEDLSGNSYADPAGYYDLVIACNDYLAKMEAFHHNYPELVAETDYFDGLYASAIRVKAWTYLTIGEIYGQALWFDDPITSIKDVRDGSIFELLNMEQLVNRCRLLLTTPTMCDGHAIDPSTEFSWYLWLDPNTSMSQSTYRYWDMMTPSFGALLCKTDIWVAAYADRSGNTALADECYKQVADTVLRMLDKSFIGNVTYWKRGARTAGNYSSFWDKADPHQEEVVSAIVYDYKKNQTNRLLYHFSDEYPNAWLLAPNDSAGHYIFENKQFAPLGASTADRRYGTTSKTHGARRYAGKFRSVGSSVRPNAYQDDVHVYTFRSAELYLWLFEALNHQGRYEALERLLNTGFNASWSNVLTRIELGEEVGADTLFQYAGMTSSWINSKTGGTYNGFRNCMGVGADTIWSTADGLHTEAEARRHNDELLANEWMLECACEGKVYPNLNRFAERYQDATIVSKRVTPKYKFRREGMEKEIASKIEGTSNGLAGYWVPWTLK